MELVFGEGLDAGVWTAGAPTLDSITVGSQGLVRLLEGQLGISHVDVGPSVRVAALVHRLGDAGAFYARSAVHDAWGTARTLLALHDALWAHGWRGEGLGCRRLEDLAAVTSGLPSGLPQRLETVTGWLGDRRVAVSKVALVDAESDGAPVLRALWAKLRAAGVIVEPDKDSRFASASPALSTLGRSHAAGFTAVAGDLSLQLVRATSPRAAARDLAATWSAEEWEQPLVVGGDGVLDEALADFGLPSLGKARASNVLLEILPLVLGLCFGPLDPEKVDQLLRLEPSPVSHEARRALSRALQTTPSTEGTEWREAMTELCLDGPTRAILDTVFVPVANDNALVRVDLLEGRLKLVEQWAAHHAPGHVEATAVLRQVATLRAQLQQAGARRLSPGAVMALANLASDSAEVSARPRTAGVHTLERPDGMLAPAKRVVWWSFTSSSSTTRLPLLRPEERAALAAIGVELPQAATQARAAASRARRPWKLAQEQLLLVCPWRDDAGEALSPHPLWDEVTSNLADRSQVKVLETSVVRRAGSRRMRLLPPRKAVTAERTLTVPHLREHPLERSESPTSVASLLGCSFRYVAAYGGHLRSRAARAWSVDARAMGLAAHTLLSRGVAAGLLEAPGGLNHAQAAAVFFDQHIARVSGLLARPDAQPDRLHVRAAFVGTIELLAAVCRDNGLRVATSEVGLQGLVDGVNVQGTPDLVLVDDADRVVVIDFKWGGESFRRDELRDGIAHQLATYAALEKLQGKRLRSAGYVILGSQQLLVVGEALQGAQRIQGPALDDTWGATQKAVVTARVPLAAGTVVVAGIKSEQEMAPTRTSVQGGRLVVVPPCEFCDLSVVCGRRAQVVPT